MQCGGLHRLDHPLDRARIAEPRPLLEEVFAGLKEGSTSWRTGVELTVGEVYHARNHPTDLVVVDRIRAVNEGVGRWALSGGQLRVWPDWSPHDDHLAPTRYRYTLPD
ncbi:hypothetical protein UK23_24650 [Lentzea aerocolonigenes]|uniref:Uncharacterized protein n=1 Tax=Lentzea aerocolonigenes TaxID=68170 RepID=A0A0F0GV15_LENAE|nr:hypothetical protein [Lentzea aerocolonigenes]KJK45867.1 hypothetical protein UK23_24650 [Lentzea aerocolonigenes]